MLYKTRRKLNNWDIIFGTLCALILLLAIPAIVMLKSPKVEAGEVTSKVESCNTHSCDKDYESALKEAIKNTEIPYRIIDNGNNVLVEVIHDEILKVTCFKPKGSEMTCIKDTELIDNQMSIYERKKYISE